MTSVCLFLWQRQQNLSLKLYLDICFCCTLRLIRKQRQVRRHNGTLHGADKPTLCSLSVCLSVCLWSNVELGGNKIQWQSAWAREKRECRGVLLFRGLLLYGTKTTVSGPVTILESSKTVMSLASRTFHQVLGCGLGSESDSERSFALASSAKISSTQ